MAVPTVSTSPSAAWWIVAEREISSMVRATSFRVSTGILLAGIAAIIVLASVFGDRPSEYAVAVTDETSAAVVERASTVVAAADESSIDAEVVSSPAAAEDLVREGEVDAALVPSPDGYDVVGDRAVEPGLSGALVAAAQSATLADNAAAEGVDLVALQSGTAVSERLLDPEAENASARGLVSFAMTLLFYLVAVGFGMTIAQSVVQEKESRVVEILASAVPIQALLWGKIVGNSLMALLQIVLIAATAVVTLQFVDLGDLGGVVREVSGWYVLFFVLGFFAMAGVWAMAGSLASRQQDLSSTTLAAQLLLFAPYMIAIAAGEQVKTVVSMLPISSAMLIPARMAEGEVPLWQLGVAALANVIAIVLTVRLGARVYERTLMRTEGRLSLREALAAAR